MDSTRFDALTKTWSTARSRRGALRLLAGAGLGALLGPRPAGAGSCGAVGAACSPAAPCCRGARCATNNTCVCRAGRTDCFGRCRDLATDERNCGECGNRCLTNRTCCGGRCVNLQTNARHCGACGRACPSGQACSNGACCPAGQTSCGGACVTLATNEAHCGACGTACPAGRPCTDGSCCEAGQALCNGACVSNACPTGGTFDRVECACKCPEGTAACATSTQGAVCCPTGRCCTSNFTFPPIVSCCQEGLCPITCT